MAAGADESGIKTGLLWKGKQMVVIDKSKQTKMELPKPDFTLGQITALAAALDCQVEIILKPTHEHEPVLRSDPESQVCWVECETCGVVMVEEKPCS